MSSEGDMIALVGKCRRSLVQGAALVLELTEHPLGNFDFRACRHAACSFLFIRAIAASYWGRPY
jgi:hypothetical protein